MSVYSTSSTWCTLYTIIGICRNNTAQTSTKTSRLSPGAFMKRITVSHPSTKLAALFLYSFQPRIYRFAFLSQYGSMHFSLHNIILKFTSYSWENFIDPVLFNVRLNIFFRYFYRDFRAIPVFSNPTITSEKSKLSYILFLTPDYRQGKKTAFGLSLWL